MHAQTRSARLATGPLQRSGPSKEDAVTVSPLTPPNAGARRPSAADALLGRIVRLQLRPMLDEALDALWSSGFTLVEAAESLATCSPLTRDRAERVEDASEELWRSLDAADELYCALAHLCASLEAATAAQR